MRPTSRRGRSPSTHVHEAVHAKPRRPQPRRASARSNGQMQPIRSAPSRLSLLGGLGTTSRARIPAQRRRLGRQVRPDQRGRSA